MVSLGPKALDLWSSEPTPSLSYRINLRIKPDKTFFELKKEESAASPHECLRSSKKPQKYLCCSGSMNSKTGACFIVCVSFFSPSFLLFKVRLSKLQKTKTYQHVADPAAKLLRDKKKKKSDRKDTD